LRVVTAVEISEEINLAEELSILVNRCLTGHQPSFQTLVERFRGQVFGLCFRMLGQREDAEDATQETMIRLVNNLHRWEQDRAFEPWLLTIAGNRCRTRLAKRKRRPTPATLDYPIQDQSHLERQAQLLAEEIDLALSHLRLEYRQAFNLFHQREMGYAEIAAELEVPLGTVKTWVHRARREIVTRLRKRGTLSGDHTDMRTV